MMCFLKDSQKKKKIPNDEEKSDHKRTAFDRRLESSVETLVCHLETG